MQLLDLNADCLLKIFSFCNENDLLNLCRSHWLLNEVIENNIFHAQTLDLLLCGHRNGPSIIERTQNPLPFAVRLKIARNWLQGCYREQLYFHRSKMFATKLFLERDWLYVSYANYLSQHKRLKAEPVQRRFHREIATKNRADIADFVKKRDTIFAGRVTGSCFIYEDGFAAEQQLHNPKEYMWCVDFANDTYVTSTDHCGKIWRRSGDLNLLDLYLMTELKSSYKTMRFNNCGTLLYGGLYTSVERRALRAIDLERTQNPLPFAVRLKIARNWLQGCYREQLYFHRSKMFATKLFLERDWLYVSYANYLSQHKRLKAEPVQRRFHREIATKNRADIADFVKKRDTIFAGRVTGSCFIYEDGFAAEQQLHNPKEYMWCVDFANDTYVTSTDHCGKIWRRSGDLNLLDLYLMTELKSSYKTMRFNNCGTLLYGGLYTSVERRALRAIDLERTQNPLPFAVRLKIARNWLQGCYRKQLYFHRSKMFATKLFLERDWLYVSYANYLSQHKRLKAEPVQRRFHREIATKNRADIADFVKKRDTIFAGRVTGSCFIYEDGFAAEQQLHNPKEYMWCVDFANDTYVTSTDHCGKIWRRSGDLNLLDLYLMTELKSSYKTMRFNNCGTLLYGGLYTSVERRALRAIDLESGCESVLNSNTISIYDLKLKDDHVLFTANFDTSFRLYDRRSDEDEIIWEDPFDSSFYCLDYDGLYAVVCGTNYHSRVNLYDIRVPGRHMQLYFPHVKQKRRGDSKSSPVYSVTCDSRYLFVATDHNVHVLDFKVDCGVSRDFSGFYRQTHCV